MSTKETAKSDKETTEKRTHRSVIFDSIFRKNGRNDVNMMGSVFWFAIQNALYPRMNFVNFTVAKMSSRKTFKLLKAS